MAKYRLKELQNLQSDCKGDEVEAASLASAKRMASKCKTFQGTTLVVESQSGRRLAYKEPGESWKDFEDFEGWYHA